MWVCILKQGPFGGRGSSTQGLNIAQPPRASRLFWFRAESLPKVGREEQADLRYYTTVGAGIITNSIPLGSLCIYTIITPQTPF